MNPGHYTNQDKEQMAGKKKILFSVVIPAHNEQECIISTLDSLVNTLNKQKFKCEIIVVADHCTDNTEKLVANFAKKHKRIRLLANNSIPGFGMAVRAGLDAYLGDAVAIFMADASDSPEDLIRYFKLIEDGEECVFGSRFMRGAFVVDYPLHKLVLNRIVNYAVALLFGIRTNDTTNAFKCYRREVIDGCRPLISPHFNLTVELPLKAVVRGFRYKVVPISWRNRSKGVSKLKLKEMGSRYLFIIIYCLLEKWMVRKDYKRETK
ncbi:MAG: glycosyltransferase family 2 protein [Victivallales bacterium]|nr:glycosyltransferase family 2 protein [Victivallales bacterium]